MGLNNKLLQFVLSAFFLFAVSLFNAEAQEPSAEQQEESQYRVVRTQEGFTINQIIYFPAYENAFRYEIEIECPAPVPEDSELESWVLLQEIETFENFFEVNLNAGNYRYRYTAYNRMNLPEGLSDWQEFQISPAVTPIPHNFRPFYGLFYDMPDPDSYLIIYGENFFKETEFALIKKRINFDWTEVRIEEQKKAFIPADVEIYENYARLVFPRGSVKHGNYEIFIRNPGGLWVCFGEVRAGYQNQNDFIIEYGWAPVYDTDNFSLNSRYVRIGWFPLKFNFGNFGIGGQFFWGDESDLLISLNILYQYRISQRLQHNGRLGVFPSFTEYAYYDTDSVATNYKTETSLAFNLGYSIQYFFWKNAYAILGIDFIYKYNLHNSGNSRFYVVPNLGIGFQIGRWGEQAEVIEGAKKGRDYSVPVINIPKGEHILSIGWAPMIPLGGIDLYGVREIYDGSLWHTPGSRYLSVFNPMGFNIRYAYMPHRWKDHKFGYEVELTILGHENYSLISDPFDLINSFLAGIRYQHTLNDNWYINARIGFGIANSYRYFEYEYSNPFAPELDHVSYTWDMCFAFDAGVSLQFFFWKDMFAQISMDVMITSADKTGVQFRPGISLGWHFRRKTETGLRLTGTGLPFIDDLISSE